MMTGLAVLLMATLQSCSSNDVQNNVLPAVTIAVEYSALKDEFKSLKQDWRESKDNYSDDIQGAVDSSIVRIQLFYDTVTGISKSKNIKVLYPSYIDAISAVSKIREAIHTDPSISQEVRDKIDKVYAEVRDFDSAVNRLFESMVSDASKNEKYRDLIVMVTQAIKLLK